MNKIISKTIKVKSPKMPPSSEFIEDVIKNSGITPLRWAIVDIENDYLTINASGEIIE